MNIELKNDWDEATERYKAWWEGEIIDRVAIQVTAPRVGYQRKHIPAPSDLEQRWLDTDYRIAAAEEGMRATFYGGEAFPQFYPNLGPDVFAGYLGCDIIFSHGTSWAQPLAVPEGEDFPEIKFDPENRWWKKILEMTQAAVDSSNGRYFVGLTDLHGGGDALAAIRGQQALCYDLVDRPQKVKKAMEFLEDFWFLVYDAAHQITLQNMQGSSTWLSVWSPGKYYAVSCDFAALISPEMFNDFFLPEVIAEIEWLDRSLFHLDGPDAIPHLDALLNIPKLGGIQWVPGAGAPSVRQWIPLLKKIQAAGKLLHLSVGVDEIEPLLEELSPKGVMFSTGCGSEADARELLNKAKKFTVKH